MLALENAYDSLIKALRRFVVVSGEDPEFVLIRPVWDPHETNFFTPEASIRFPRRYLLELQRKHQLFLNVRS